jgi:hypothetical protein
MLNIADGVATHDCRLYAGDGNSTLKVFDLLAPNSSALKQSIFTNGKTALSIAAASFTASAAASSCRRSSGRINSSGQDLAGSAAARPHDAR